MHTIYPRISAIFADGSRALCRCTLLFCSLFNSPWGSKASSMCPVGRALTPWATWVGHSLVGYILHKGIAANNHSIFTWHFISQALGLWAARLVHYVFRNWASFFSESIIIDESRQVQNKIFLKIHDACNLWKTNLLLSVLECGTKKYFAPERRPNLSNCLLSNQ